MYTCLTRYIPNGICGKTVMISTKRKNTKMNIPRTKAFLAIVATLGALAALVAIGTVPAYADPSESHGTCRIGDGSDNGAFGCAGNVGGFIVTPQGKCIDQNTPFSQFTCLP
jgi:hypothetical protein